jgi:hypothetical protein
MKTICRPSCAPIQSAGSTRDMSIFVGTTFVNLSMQVVTSTLPLGTHDMVADTYTKRLPAPALVRHREILNF